MNKYLKEFYKLGIIGVTVSLIYLIRLLPLRVTLLIYFVLMIVLIISKLNK